MGAIEFAGVAVIGPRSVAELLPRAFDELTVTDVKEIVQRVGEERESLFFERKLKVDAATLAKSCAAFANTYGGLLVVGIEDATGELKGTELPGRSEPQVWVKDLLRPNVLPMPAFRARWIPLTAKDKRGLLLVLVAESSTTPHLLTQTGAIYVRNPGSSDPRPINDQARLLELTRRGRETRTQAYNRAHEMIQPGLAGQWLVEYSCLRSHLHGQVRENDGCHTTGLSAILAK